MKINYFTILIIFFLNIGCHKRVVKSDLDLLSGYWRIDFITQKKETFRPKGMTKLLDYYALEKNNGVRKITNSRMPLLGTRKHITRSIDVI